MKQSIIPESEHEVARAESPFVTDETADQEVGDQAKVQMLARSEIQFRFGGEPTTDDVHSAAEDGIQEAPSALPHGDAIQRSFGHHAVGGVKAHVGGRAAEASEAMGADAYATGSDIGFKTAPDLHTAAHEAAHVVQQRGGVQLAGGVGVSGDRYEQHADAVADRVVAGGSAEAMLDGVAAAGGSAAGAVQRKDPPPIPTSKPWLKPPAVGTGVVKPPRPKSPKPPRPRTKHPPRPKTKKKLARGSQKPKLPPKPMAPVVEEEPLEEITPDGTILTPVLVDGKWEMIEEEPLEEIPPEPEEREEKQAKKKVAEEVKKDEEEAKTEDSSTTAAKSEIAKKVEDKGVSNAEAKDRIQKGAAAVDNLTSKVLQVVEKKPEPEPEPEAPAKSSGGIFSGIKKFFQGIGKMFGSKSSTEESATELLQRINLPEVMQRPPQPEKDRGKASADLGKLKTKLDSRVGVIDKAETAGTPVAKTELSGAKNDCDRTAEKIRPNADEQWVLQVIDIGVGIGAGFHAMAKHALSHAIVPGDVKFGSKLGSGGSNAVVFNATYLGMAPMAYKNEKRMLTDDRDVEEMMVPKEAKKQSGFDHTNILKGGQRVDRGESPGYLMEKAEHGDLEGLIKKMHAEKGGLTAEERMLVMRYLMRGGFRGLEEVHKKNMVHGDIKHQNFLIGEDDELKLMDFGLSETEEAKPADRTKRAGTSEFMAPEVLDTGLEKKSDIWSMAETLLVGVFDRDSVDLVHGKKGEKYTKGMKETKRAHFGGDAWHTKLEAKVDTLKGSAQFKDFLKKAMKFNPAERATATQCLQHQFLNITEGDEIEAKKLLEKLLG